MTKAKLLKRLKEIEIIHKERVVLRSGAVSDFYCDIKKAYGYPYILNALGDEMGKLLPKGTTCIAASGYGGLPLAAVVASRCNKKFVAIRNSEKNHGKGGMIDGYIPQKKDKVVIVDDVLTSGSSIRETLSTLKKHGVKATRAIVVVKRGNPKLPIPYYFVFTIDELTRD